MAWGTLLAAGGDLLEAAKRGALGGAVKVAIAAAVVVVVLVAVGLFQLVVRLFRKGPAGEAKPDAPEPPPEEAGGLFGRMFGAARVAAVGDTAAAGPPDHARINRRILILGFVVGSAGLALGLLFLRSTDRPDNPNTDWGAALKTIALLTFASYFVGISVGCLTAPAAFFDGPVGQRWLKLIGTRSVAAARLVCLALIVLVVGLVSAAVALAVRLR
jgi:hypothetical protein